MSAMSSTNGRQAALPHPALLHSIDRRGVRKLSIKGPDLRWIIPFHHQIDVRQGTASFSFPFPFLLSTPSRAATILDFHRDNVVRGRERETNSKRQLTQSHRAGAWHRGCHCTYAATTHNRNGAKLNSERDQPWTKDLAREVLISPVAS